MRVNGIKGGSNLAHAHVAWAHGIRAPSPHKADLLNDAMHILCSMSPRT